jgi:hypothetical protein
MNEMQALMGILVLKHLGELIATWTLSQWL